MTFDAQAEAALARRSFPEFCALMDSRFADPPPFMRMMMDDFADVESGKCRFLALSLPPRHSKTTLGCVLMPSWVLGRAPTSELVIASHSTDLAERSSRLSRDLLLSDAWPFQTKLATDSTAATRWHVNGGGSVRALGVGSALLGRGADILWVDDAIADGNSEIECAQAWDWLQRIAASRLNKGGRIIVIGQRLRENDLIGNIIEDKTMGAQFKVVNLPAVCEDETLAIEQSLGRHNGEALWPSQFGLDELAVRQKIMSPRDYCAQFLGQPLAHGDLVHSEWLFDNRYDRIPEEGKIVFGLDSASKQGLSNCYSALAVITSTKTNYYLIDMIRQKLDYPGLKRMLILAAEQYNPSAIYAEDTSNATALIQELKAETRLPIVPVQARGSKQSRWEAQTGLLESGRVLFPSDRLNAHWFMDFAREMLGLPNGRFDDQADAFFIALAAVARKNVGDWYFATLANVKRDDVDTNVYTKDGIYVPNSGKPPTKVTELWPKGINPAKPNSSTGTHGSPRW